MNPLTLEMFVSAPIGVSLVFFFIRAYVLKWTTSKPTIFMDIMIVCIWPHSEVMDVSQLAWR